MIRALLARLWPFSTAKPDEESPEDPDEDTSEDDGPIRTWDFIPDWQYTGWQAETGGLTVDEQEKALADIQAQAEAIEDAEAVERAESGDADQPEESRNP